MKSWRRVGFSAGALWFFIAVCNFAAAPMGANDNWAHPHAVLVMVSGNAVFGLLGIVISRVASDEMVARFATPWVIFSLAGGVPIACLELYFSGFKLGGFATPTLGIFILYGFYLLRRWAAIALVAESCAAFTTAMLLSPDAPAPMVGALWVSAVITIIGFVVGGVMKELDTSRHREAEARHDERLAREQLAVLNATLEDQVAQQVGEIERLGRLRRFLPAAVADSVVSDGQESMLTAHRREIAVLFADLRGFTAFANKVEPEEVIDVLDQYYNAAGEELSTYGATVGSFAGDGIFAYLNDPYPTEDPARQVVNLAVSIAQRLDVLEAEWRRFGYQLSYGIGLAMGHATLGAVGYDERRDYTALGTVVNRGARLCAHAAPKQIIVDHRIQLLTDGDIGLGSLPPMTLKGFDQPVAVYEVIR